MEAAQKAEVRRPRIPKINPTVAPFLVCSNRDCNEILKPVAVKGKGGFVPDVVYVCPNCEYKFTLSLVPALGECKPLSDAEREALKAKA